MSRQAPDSGSPREFWTGYQPGLATAEAQHVSREEFARITARRYALEPDILEQAEFERWTRRDVLEAGCGIATDGMQFVRAGARYTGVDFSSTALETAERRVWLEGGSAHFVRGSVTDLPFPDASFDLVYSNGVIHHVPDTARAIAEFHRVLRPGGTALVMVYHRASLNFFVSIMTVRRLIVPLLLVPGAAAAITRVTGERPGVIEGHRALLVAYGRRYLTDPALFLSNNTDGPGNPLSKVYTAAGMRAAFGCFGDVRTEVRFLNLRAYPLGERLERLPIIQRLGRRAGWHLWVRAVKT
jgi:SAM-dependent methyltransferase